VTWFKIDDDFFFHPKVIAAGNSAIGLFVRCGSWASNHLTDGFIPDKVIEMFGTDTDITRLVEVGLLEEADNDGYFMPAFLDYNPSADEVKATRAASAERQRQSRTRRNDDQEHVTRESRVSHNDVTRDSRVSHSAPTRPDPTRKTPPPPDNARPVDKSVDEVVEVVAKTIMSESPPESPPRNIGNYLAGVRRRLKADHPDLGALVTQLGAEGAAAAIVAREITQPDLEPKPPEPQHDPDCPECAGSGWRTIDHDHNIVGPCDCEPSGHVATVTELRRTS